MPMTKWRPPFAIAGLLAAALVGTSCFSPTTPSPNPSPEETKPAFLSDITPSGKGLPLASTRYNSLSRVAEYLVLGADYNGAGNY